MKDMTRDHLIVGSILGVIVGVAFFAAYFPQGRAMARLDEQIAAQRASLAADASRAALVPELARQVEAMRARYKNFDQKMPKQKELGGFLTEISENMSKAVLSNQLIEPGNPVRESLFHTLPITMRFKGSYLALTGLLDRIDKMQRLTRVRKLQVKNDPKSPDLDIELEMNIYFTES